MTDENTDLLAGVSRYYGDKHARHGDTPRGVDWNSEESQLLRFSKLCGIIPDDKPFSLNDLGCGYGALRDFLAARYRDFSYLGVDVAEEMVRAAGRRAGPDPRARFIRSSAPDRVADYGVASGIFNVRLACPDATWLAHVEATLESLDRTSRLGFAFNCLTAYSDADRKLDYLFYADPCLLFDLCKRRYSRQVALLHDYGLYEFTILVRKT